LRKRVKGGHVVTSVTVPLDLKERMRQFPHINWSEIATEAFKEKVEEQGE
jgi:post-segregation antitoxin (ccd killing protein)